MSIEALSWVLNDAPVSDQGQLCVLIGLANHADRYGRDAYPAHATLAEYARCSVRTVARHLAAMEVAGVIGKGDQRRTAHLPGNRRPTVWDITIMATRGVTRDMSPCHPTASRGVTRDMSHPVRGDSAGSLGVTTVADKPSLEPLIETRVDNSPSAGARVRDPRRCGKHQDDYQPPPCGRCGEARRGTDRAEREQARQRQRAEHADKLAATVTYWQNVNDCTLCDARGYLRGGAVCRHDADAPGRATAGAATCRSALRGASA